MSSLLDTCLAELNKRIDGLNIDQKSIVLITKYAMEIVEATSLKGDAQKKMVLEMLKKVIQDSPLSNEEKEVCTKLVDDGTIDQIIDLVVDASKGELKINKKQAFSLAERCLPLCLTCIKNRG
jgi:hypothetical protein